MHSTCWQNVIHSRCTRCSGPRPLPLLVCGQLPALSCRPYAANLHYYCCPSQHCRPLSWPPLVLSPTLAPPVHTCTAAQCNCCVCHAQLAKRLLESTLGLLCIDLTSHSKQVVCGPWGCTSERRHKAFIAGWSFGGDQMASVHGAGAGSGMAQAKTGGNRRQLHRCGCAFKTWGKTGLGGLVAPLCGQTACNFPWC